jgi:hypothetical protein
MSLLNVENFRKHMLLVYTSTLTGKLVRFLIVAKDEDMKARELRLVVQAPEDGGGHQMTLFMDPLLGTVSYRAEPERSGTKSEWETKSALVGRNARIKAVVIDGKV